MFSALALTVTIIGSTLVPSGFCNGIRFDAVTYKNHLMEYALNVNIAREIQEAAEAKALKEGRAPDTAYAEGLKARAEAKLAEYLFQSGYVKGGQVHKCGKISNNW